MGRKKAGPLWNPAWFLLQPANLKGAVTGKIIDVGWENQSMLISPREA
jgi:hypothetical protein